MPTFPASQIDGVFLKGAYLFLECKMERVLDGFGKHSMIVGFVEAAHVDRSYLNEGPGQYDPMEQAPLLAYVNPGRYARVDATEVFPHPTGFQE